MDTQAILKRVEDILSPILAKMDYDLVERELVMESGRLILRIYIDRERGITIDDCELVSRSIEDILGVEEVIPGIYSLEVSSPGLNRPLRRRGDFEKYSGSTVRVKTVEPIDGRENYKGILIGVDNDDVLMDVDGGRYRIPLDKIFKARLVSEISFRKSRPN